VDIDPAVRPGAGVEALRILSGPVRALDAAGAGPGVATLIADFAASIAAAGYLTGPISGGSERPEWATFLRDRPASIVTEEPEQFRELRAPLGRLRGRAVTITSVAWSPKLVQLRAIVRPPTNSGVDPGGWWTARATDEAGMVHLGQPGLGLSDGGASLVFRLRPGLQTSSGVLEVRIASAGECVEGVVEL